MHGRMLRELIGDEDTDLVALDAFDSWPRRLAVIAPQMCRHAGSEFALCGFGNEVKLLPIVLHSPGQRPAVQSDDRLIIGPVGRQQWWLHRICRCCRRFGKTRCLRATAHYTGSAEYRRTDQTPSREHCWSPLISFGH